jgi:hypothetical protein
MSHDEVMPEEQPTICPHCACATGDCEHLFAVIDQTFSTASRAAEKLFDELAASNPNVGVT